MTAVGSLDPKFHPIFQNCRNNRFNLGLNQWGLWTEPEIASAEARCIQTICVSLCGMKCVRSKIQQCWTVVGATPPPQTNCIVLFNVYKLYINVGEQLEGCEMLRVYCCKFHSNSCLPLLFSWAGGVCGVVFKPSHPPIGPHIFFLQKEWAKTTLAS